MSHTPGPWIAELLLFNRTDEMRFLLSTPDDELGHIQLRNTNIYDALANARVIAAAPDLLAACEFLVKCCELNHWALMADEEIELVEMAEKAVKKARGES